MAEENKPQETEEKKPAEAKPVTKTEAKPEEKIQKKEEKKPEAKPTGKVEAKPEEKKPEKKEEKKEIPKKEEAVANGINLHASKKNCMYICRFIKNKTIDFAIKDLEDVIKMKKAVPFKGEIPHRKGKGMMSGRYPVKASKLFINLLKSLKGNVLVNGLDLDRTRISMASASWAARPLRRGGRQFKRTNIILKAKEVGK